MIPRKRNGYETGIYGAGDSPAPAAKKRRGLSVVSLTPDLPSSGDSDSDYTPSTDPSDSTSDEEPEKKPKGPTDRRPVRSDVSNAVDEAAESNMLAGAFCTTSPRESIEGAQWNGAMDTAEFVPSCVRSNCHCDSHIDDTAPVDGSSAHVPDSVSDVVVLDRPVEPWTLEPRDREEKGVQTDIFQSSQVAEIQVQGPSHVGCLRRDEIHKYVGDYAQRTLKAEDEARELKHRLWTERIAYSTEYRKGEKEVAILVQKYLILERELERCKKSLFERNARIWGQS